MRDSKMSRARGTGRAVRAASHNGPASSGARFGRLPKAAIAADGIDFEEPLVDIGPTILTVVAQ
jgi:hypothetical protein